MRGTIIKRKSGYSIVLSLGKDPNTGKYKQQWIAVEGNKKDAETKMAEILRQKDTGMYVNPNKITTGEFLERWLDAVKPNLSERTYEGYRSIVRVHLGPSLGKNILSQLKPENIQKYYSDKLKSKCLNKNSFISPRTVRRHAMCLHNALETAVKWNLLPRNVADAVDPPPDTQSEMSVMNEDDIRIFLEAAKKTQYYSLFYSFLFTGTRRSELLAMRWSDIDLLLCRLSVTRSIHQLQDRRFIFKQPKSKKGRRLISLSPSNTLILKEHKENEIARRMLLGTTLKEDDLVFCHPNGSPLLPDTVSNAWRKLAKSVGLKNCHLHIARHSMASKMLKDGIHPAIVQNRLGHASIQTTIDTYSHILPGLAEAAAAKLDSWLMPKHHNEPVKVASENDY